MLKKVLEAFDEFQACRGVVRVPVFRTVVDEKSGVEQLREALKIGFDVNYIHFSLCEPCKISGGRCGFVNTQQQFLCFCHYGIDHDSVCNVFRVGM